VTPEEARRLAHAMADDLPEPGDGRHVKILLRNGDPERLNDLEVVRAFLGELVATLGMRAIHAWAGSVPLELARMGREPYQDEGGVTGIVVLTTSHIAAHTWPLQGRMVLDVYSCRDFDALLVLKLAQQRFQGPGGVPVPQVRVTELGESLQWPE
jgi:S-adenosylmethionine decarboxylase